MRSANTGVYAKRDVPETYERLDYEEDLSSWVRDAYCHEHKISSLRTK